MSRPNIGRRKCDAVVDEFLARHSAGELTLTESRYAASSLKQARELLAADPGAATRHVRAAMSCLEAGRGRAETKSRRSAAQRANWDRPGMRERQSEAMKEAWARRRESG